MQCEIKNCGHSAYRASGFCLDHLNYNLASKGQVKCRNSACSNISEYFGLCGHCQEIYRQGKVAVIKQIKSGKKINILEKELLNVKPKD